MSDYISSINILTTNYIIRDSLASADINELSTNLSALPTSATTIYNSLTSLSSSVSSLPTSVTTISNNLTALSIKVNVISNDVDYLSGEIDNRPGNVLISADSTSSMTSAVVNYVTLAEYMQLSVQGELLSNQFYVIDENPFDNNTKITFQYYDDNDILRTIEDDLSIVTISSYESFESAAFNNTLQRNVIYKISADTFKAYGKRITDIADPIDLSDAVNLLYFIQNTPLYDLLSIYPSVTSLAGSFYATNHCIHHINYSAILTSLTIYVPSYTGKQRSFYVNFLNIGTPTISLVPTDSNLISLKSTANPAVSLTSYTYNNYIHFYEIRKNIFAYTILRISN